MKKLKFFGFCKAAGMVFAAVAMSGLTSCGGDPNSVTLEAKPELGDLSNFITLDSKDVKISLSEVTDEGVPCIKLSSTIQVTVDKAVASNYGFNFSVEFLDKDMNLVSAFKFDYKIEDEHDYDNGEFTNYLKAGSYRAILDETVKKSEWDSTPEAKQAWDNIRKDAKYIVIKPYWSGTKFVEYTGKGGSEENVSESADEDDEIAGSDLSSGSEDWDKILDEYESYCNKTVSIAKKVQAGDMSAMTEYASLLESAQSLENKLNNAKDDLTPAQVARLSKIAAKLAQSMM